MLRQYRGVTAQISELVDLFLMSVGFFVVIELYKAKNVIVNSEVLMKYFVILLTYILFWVFSTGIYKVYYSRRFMSVSREVAQMVKAHFLSFSLCLTMLVLIEPNFINNRFIFYFEAVVLVLTVSLHIFTRIFLETARKAGRNKQYILLLGSGPAAKMYLQKVNENPQLGYKLIGYLAPERNGIELHYLGDYTLLESVMKLNIVDLVVVTALISDEEIKNCLELLDVMGKNVVIMLDDIATKIARSHPVDFDGLSMVAYDSHPRRPWQALGKRFLDVSLTAIGMLMISPVLIAIALAVKLTSKGPVIFSQERVGLNGRSFKMYKFRSMVQDAEELKAKLAHLNEMSGPVFKIKNDPRITPVGKFLRKTSLDELPQLWNVLKGDMSLVGPRPPLPSEVNMYDPKHRKRLAVKPGITCIWQISGRNDVDFEQWMEMDADYVDRWSLWLDVEILAKTVPVVLMRKGAS